MSGRHTNGKTQLRNTDTPRKRIKILSGTHFHWMAYNTETKEFMGTSGGIYTTENKENNDKIEFFPREK
jgi:Golgi nucleoside diphosphatase